MFPHPYLVDSLYQRSKNFLVPQRKYLDDDWLIIFKKRCAASAISPISGLYVGEGTHDATLGRPPQLHRHKEGPLGEASVRWREVRHIAECGS